MGKRRCKDLLTKIVKDVKIPKIRIIKVEMAFRSNSV